MTIHLLLIDDHALFRSGIGMVLSAGLGNMELSEAASLEEALQGSNEAIDLILLDVQLDGLNGLDGIALLKHKWPLAKVVVVSAAQESEVANEALARGAHGFICKAEMPGRMLELVSRVLAGDNEAVTAGVPAEGIRLTPRQCEVLDLLCQGLSNKMIGRRLNLSENTVRGHVQAMLATLQVSSRSEAAFVARRLRLIH